jgi:hypothetical protein
MLSVELRVAEEAGFDVHVRVLKAVGLPPMERGGGCNTLVRGESGDQVQESRVRWKTRSPNWPPADVGDELLFKDLVLSDEVRPAAPTNPDNQPVTARDEENRQRNFGPRVLSA